MLNSMVSLRCWYLSHFQAVSLPYLLEILRQGLSCDLFKALCEILLVTKAHHQTDIVLFVRVLRQNVHGLIDPVSSQELGIALPRALCEDIGKVFRGDAETFRHITLREI